MGLSEAQWRSLQIRSVDPYASYYSDIVNRHTRIVTGGRDTIIQGLEVTNADAYTLNVTKGIAVKDDVVLQFTSDISIDFNDSGFYIDGQVANESGIYYLVIVYKYEKIRPAPYARILLCKKDQYDPTVHLFLSALQIEYFNPPGSYGISAVIDHDPTNPDIKRISPSLLDAYRGKPCGLASLDCDGHIPADELWIDDTQKSTRILWSSQKIQDELDALRVEATRSSLTAEYDPYQDWLQQSRYLALTCDTFVDTNLIDLSATNATIDLENRRVVGLAGHVFQTTNLYNNETAITDIAKIAFAADFNGEINWYVSRDGGTTWEPITLDEYGVSDNYVFLTQSGLDLRIRAEFITDGVIYSYGILYGEDLDWTQVDTADASNVISWTPPQITLVSGTSIEIGRLVLPSDRMLYIKRITIARADGGPEMEDLFVRVNNITDGTIVIESYSNWWEGVIAIASNKTVSIEIVNNTASDLDVLVSVTGFVTGSL